MSALPIQIVPSFPPVPGGVGDYACCVERVAAARSGTRSHFVTADGARAAAGDSTAGVTRLGQRSAAALLEALERAAGRAPDAPLLLHCSGYGYAGNGAPRWLLDGIERFLARRPAPRFAVVFHELYATSPPWRRAFWHSRAQRGVACALARLATRALCTTEANEAILGGWNPALDLTRLAVSSSMGEPEDPRAWDERAPRLLVFGLRETRAALYRAPALLRRACDALGVAQIADVGPPLGELADVGRPIVRHGAVSPALFAELAADCRYGALRYPAGPLAKSGVFAAYCAHGVAPIVFANDSAGDGLAPGVHYVRGEAIGAGTATASVARSALAWYQGHRLSEHARWLQSTC